VTRRSIAGFGLADEVIHRPPKTSRFCRLHCLWWVLFLVLEATAQSWESEADSRLVGVDQKIEVRAGQSLYDVARAQGFALEHLAEANGLPVSLSVLQTDQVLVPSRRILPPNPPANGLVINLPERGFYVFREGQEARFFPIAIGEPGRFQTPPGKYSILEKVVDPQWIAPEWAGLGEDNVVPAGPDNPLGDRWIGLTWAGLGMHSTNNPSSVGSATSHGCMRMYPEIARRVFDMVEVGWPVTIEYETSRASLEKDGIYAVCFPDPYSSADQEGQLKDNFRELDLEGFYHRLDPSRLLARKSGVCERLVDFTPKVRVGTSKFPAARIEGKLYLDGATLDALEVKQEFQLAEQSVKLSSQGASSKQRLGSKNDGAFLSRGTAWYPAGEVLKALSFPYQWDGSSNELVVEPRMK